MNNPPTKRFVLVLWAAMAFVSPSSVFAQFVRPFAAMKPVAEKKETSRKDFILFQSSRWFLRGTTAADAITTAHLMSHPTIAALPDGRQIARIYPEEIGWTGLMDRHNEFLAVGGNIVVNTLTDYFSGRLCRKGKWECRVATGLNFLKGSLSLAGAIHNIGYESRLDGKVRAATGVTGHIVWR